MSKSKSLANPTFDYSQVSADVKSSLIYFEGQLSHSRKRVAEEILKHGEMLRGAQAALADHNNGVFVAWLDSIGVTPSSAYRAIEAFAAFDGFPNWENLEVSAMYALAKNDKAKTKALKLADSGVKVTHAMAKELIEKSAPKPSASKPAPQPAAEPFVEPADNEAPEWATGPEFDPPATESEPADYGRCPNCAGKKWTTDDDGVWCAKCNHPHGEPTGGADDDRVATARSKVVKSVEATMRAVDDLQHLCPRNDDHADAIEILKRSLEIARGWR